ncbi:MAG: rhomboid family intramembrane serine protease [Gammaproteobacteria bacterium]|nr:rhomboid family intramembrane serine protease [Gammaproteobacteria bacterium]
MIPLHDDNPTQIFPYLTIGFIIACVLVFFWEISYGEEMQKAIYMLGAVPATIFENKLLPPELQIVPSWATMVTSMFMHGGWMHLIGNMLYLWIYGNNVEDCMGHVRFVVFYILCGLGAFLAHALTNTASEIPMVGASGAISGVLGAYLLIYPHARILVVIPLGFYFHTMRLPAGVVIGFWFLLQFINSAMSGDEGGGVAWYAHIGGFLVGMALIPFFKYSHVTFFHPIRRA